MPVFNRVTKAISNHTNELCTMKQVCGKYKLE